jgi:hypothetical protein
MKTHERAEVMLQAFLSFPTDRGEWMASQTATYIQVDNI